MKENDERTVMMVETGGWGGIGHYAHCLAEALSAQGVKLRLVTHSNHYQLQDFSKHYTVEQVFVGDGFLADWKRLYHAWQGEPIIHFQSLLSTRRDWIAFLMLKWLKPKVALFVTVHNVLPHELAKGETWAYRRLYQMADGLIVHSKATHRSLMHLMGENFNTPIAVIPHGHYGEITGLVLPSRDEALDTLGLDKNFHYLVCFGAIRPYKGIDLLMKAIALTSHWPSDVKVLVIGHLLTGVSENELLLLRTELGLENVVIFNFSYVPEQHIPHVFAATDVSLLPYRHIDQSGILMAALAAGKPVMCTPVGAFPEVVKESFGFLAEDISEKSIAKCLEDLFLKRNAWSEMGIEAKSIAHKEFDWTDIAKNTLQFYDRVIHN